MKMKITSVSVTPQKIDMSAPPGTLILFTVTIKAWGPFGPDRERHEKGYTMPDCTYEKALAIIDSYRSGAVPTEAEVIEK